MFEIPTRAKILASLTVFRFLRVTAGLLLLGTLIWYVSAHPRELAQLSNLSVWAILAVFCLRLAAYVCFVISTWWLIRLEAPTIGLGEYFLLSAGGVALNAMSLPGSGYAAKAIYLKQRHSLKHREFLAVNSLIGLLVLAASGLLAGLALSVVQLREGDIAWLLWTLAGLTFFGPIVVVALVEPVSSLLFSPLYESGQLQFGRLLNNKGRLVTTALAQLTRGGLSFLAFGILFQELSGEPVLKGGILDALSTLLRLVHLVPGNVGLYEWGVAGLSDALGAPLAAGMLAAVLFRLIGLASILLPALLAQFVLKLPSCPISGRDER